MRNASFLFFLLSCGILDAQALSPKVLASSGNTLVTTNARLSFTVGETAIATLAAPNISCGQGFHNGATLTVSTKDLNLETLGIKVFPNPAAQTLFVELDAKNGDKTRYARVWDVQGKQLLQPIYLNPLAVNPISVGQLPTGIYLLELSDSEGLSATLQFVKAE